MSSVPNNLKLKIGSDGVSDLKFHPEQDTLVVGTVGGRIRIYDCTYDEPVELFRKRWHENLTRIAISKSGTKIMSSSSQGGIKIHDFATGTNTWKCLKAHEDSVSALVWQTEHLFISGDERGTIKIWDARQESCVCDVNVSSSDDQNQIEYLGAVNDLVLDSNGRHLFAAMDDGNLVTVNMRKREVELCSESLSYSVKSIQPFKDQSKLAVATDEGVISIFNWNEFGNLSDRFPVSSVDDPIERMVKINENVMAMSTASGKIKAASLLPNLVLTDIGKHSFARGDDNCGDCMAIAINADSSFLVSGCPESDVVCFYSPDIIVRESKLERQDRAKNKRKKDRAVTKDRHKRRKMENDGFLDGMVSDEDENVIGAEDKCQESSGDEDDDSSGNSRQTVAIQTQAPTTVTYRDASTQTDLIDNIIHLFPMISPALQKEIFFKNIPDEEEIYDEDLLILMASENVAPTTSVAPATAVSPPRPIAYSTDRNHGGLTPETVEVAPKTNSIGYEEPSKFVLEVPAKTNSKHLVDLDGPGQKRGQSPSKKKKPAIGEEEYFNNKSPSFTDSPPKTKQNPLGQHIRSKLLATLASIEKILRK